MQEFQDIWVYLSANLLLHLTLTMTAFVAASIVYIKARLNPLQNSMLLSVIAIIAILYGTDTSYDIYFEGAQFVHFLLGPATVALAIPLYRHSVRVLNSALAILVSLVAGAFSGLAMGLNALATTILLPLLWKLLY